MLSIGILSILSRTVRFSGNVKQINWGGYLHA